MVYITRDGRRRVDSSLQSQPARAIVKACAKDGIDPMGLDLIEINEAFSTVGIASTRALGIDANKVNVDGGAVAIGHPLGESGARIALHLALELLRRGGGVGAVAVCGERWSGRRPDYSRTKTVGTRLVKAASAERLHAETVLGCRCFEADVVESFRELRTVREH